MEYRNIETLGAAPSLLGYGCMRFPTLDDESIDEPQARRLLDRAIEGGVNYFDTAYFYHKGASENFMSRALAQYPRGSYYLTSKLPTVLVHDLDEARRIFDEQWERLDRTYLDFYLLHNLNGERWRLLRDQGVVDWCLDLQRQGLFRRFGFSFHGSYDEFEEILTAREWDLCQLQLNYMDTNEQAGLRGYALTEKRGVPLVIMEPVKGGALANPPAEAMELFQRARPGASAASWALRWAASLPNVMTVLSGMSTLEQVEDNLATFNAFRPLDEGERAVVEQAAAVYRRRVRSGCTGCRYCMPCPAGVDIPRNFTLWNEYGIYGSEKQTASRWRDLEEERKGKNCLSCGQCEEACPQHLSIREDLKRLQTELDGLL